MVNWCQKKHSISFIVFITCCVLYLNTVSCDGGGGDEIWSRIEKANENLKEKGGE